MILNIKDVKNLITMNRKKILYISYDGMTDALGQSQVLSYLTKLTDENEIHILSFEKKENYSKNAANVIALIENSGLFWIKKWYTKKPPVISTIYDVVRALNCAKKLHREHKFDIVHCRGYISALIGLGLKKHIKIKFIFDMRGWWADEKKESGTLSSFIFKPVYRFFKRKESDFFRKSDFVVSLTEIGKREIIDKFEVPESKIGVIPTCVNLELFKAYDQLSAQMLRRKLNIPENATVLAYSGSLGGNYDLNILKTVFRSFSEKFADPYILVLSKDTLTPEMERAFAEAGIGHLMVYSVSYNQVSDYLCAADLGFVFYKPAYSLIGRSPTKLGEYWASGLPVVATRGIGDFQDLHLKYPGGLALFDDTLSDVDQAFSEIKFDRTLMRSYATDYHDLKKGVLFYKNVYANI